MNPTAPFLFSLGLLLAGLAAASAAAKPDDPPALMVRAQVEFIEVSGGQLDELLFGEAAPTTDSALREQVGKLVAAKQAAIVETLAASARFSGKGTAESVREQIYPTEWENPETPEEVRGGGKDGKPALGPRDFAVGYMPSAWDTRDVGSVLEIEPQFENDDGTLDLNIYNEDRNTITVALFPEWVGETADQVWMAHKDEWGDASLRMPTFVTVRCDTSLVLKPGRFALAGVVTPQPEPPPPALSRKVLVFVRADLPRQ